MVFKDKRGIKIMRKFIDPTIEERNLWVTVMFFNGELMAKGRSAELMYSPYSQIENETLRRALKSNTRIFLDRTLDATHAQIVMDGNPFLLNLRQDALSFCQHLSACVG